MQFYEKFPSMDKDFTRKRHQLNNGFSYNNMGKRKEKKIAVVVGWRAGKYEMCVEGIETWREKTRFFDSNEKVFNYRIIGQGRVIIGQGYVTIGQEF